LLSEAIPLCCTTNPVRYLKFRQTLKGFSSKTLAIRLRELQYAGILERQEFNESPPRVEYRLTNKVHELVESIRGLHWMRKCRLKRLEDDKQFDSLVESVYYPLAISDTKLAD
jgi:DNA-binding HxlR family transcriptional regulator